MRSGPGDLSSVRVAFEAWGRRGPRLLLLHSIGLDRHSWEGVASELSDECCLVAVDLPGHGESEKPATADYGIQSLARRTLGVLDDLGWENAVLVGNSLGGGVSLAMALQAPERVRGLALFNSVAYRQALPLVGRLAFLPAAEFSVALAPSPLLRAGLAAGRRRWGTVSSRRCDLTRRYLRSPEGRGAFLRALRHLYGPDLDGMAPQYPEITCPTLVAHGVQDPILPVRFSARLAATLPGARMETITGCGHFPPEERPEEVVRLLRSFVGGLAGEAT